MNKVFEKEWELYRKDGTRPALRGTAKKASALKFDAPVMVGEIRIFADMNRPFVALVLENRGKIGYRLIPVSPFTVPASSRELLVGERVFQLWNACTAAKSFVERSWTVETLDAADLADLTAALGKMVSGALSTDELVRAYEREFLVSGGDFRDWTAGGVSAAVAWWRTRAAWGVAAMLMVCCGIGGLWYEDVLRERRVAAVDAKSARIVAYREKLLADVNAEALVEEESEEFVEDVDVAVDVEIMPAPPAPVPPPLESRSEYRREARLQALSSPVAMEAVAGTVRSWSGKTQSGGFGMMLSKHAASTYAVETGERYAEFSENEFKSPLSDPLSTFSLDVDTASYTTMRRYLTDHHCRPPARSVRLEEYVNYFSYDYPEPNGTSPLAVNCELAACPWNAQHQLLRLGVQAKRVQTEKIPPCNLTFLVDVSGSMEWHNGIGLAKQGLKLLVSKLRDVDHVAIVTYANGTEVRLPSTPGTEKAKIVSVIDGLMAGGGTSGAAGIQLAYDEAKKNFSPSANNRVILVTDGDFNIGIASPKELENFISEKRSSGIYLTVLGVGAGNYQDATMKKLANAGNGNYAFLDSPLEAKKVMMNEFGGTLLTVAKDVKLQVEFNPAAVAGYRLLGYENRQLAAKDFNDDKKDAGEIGAGHTMTALYEIIPAGLGEAVGSVDPLKYQKTSTRTSDELFTVKLRYKEPSAETSRLVEEAHKAAEIRRAEPSEDFRFAAAVAEYALLLEDSKFKGTASFAQVIERAHNAKGADRDGLRAEFIRLVERAELGK